MVGSLSERYETDRSPKGVLSGQLSQSKEAVPEWRSCEQVENGTPSTSPSYWDTDEDDDSGAKPSELYGTHTWKIEKYSQINKKELKSDAFEAGGYKWYILIYPQGCDVCNHLSLFLCVANHDKLLPGWSHFAQFTIAVVSKDTNKFKYSDTLHRFTKKEHDWGWKKFMELSGIDGYIVDDTLHIKAQVQVIRDKAYRPFRCLNYLYRRELAHIYLTNVEQICRRFFEERRGKLRKLIEDKEMWSSFSAFWLGIEQSDRRRMSREKTDVILKIIVKQFFMAKEVASTLVMDSLYSGLKALECQSKTKKSRAKPLDTEETPPPVIHVEKDMFVLADDILTLLGRAALEPLPPKDEKGHQNRAKDGSSREDISKDSAERVEKRLIELGRRTVEFFSLAHIFSTKIEVAYQEAVALKRQEELIREEEAAGQAESEQKAKRGVAEKGKKTKKKQSKHRRNSHKGKDKERDEKFVMEVQYKPQQDSHTDERTAGNFSPIQTLSMLENSDTCRDVNEISDTGEDATEILQPELEDGDVSSPTNWDTDTSDLHPYAEASSCKMSGIPAQNGCEGKKSTSVMDDSSSTCSTDSVPSLEMTGPQKWSSLPDCKSRTLPMRVKNQRGKDRRRPIGAALETDNQPGGSFTDAGHLDDGSGSCKTVTPKSEAAVHSLKDRIQWLEQHLVEKEVEVVSLQRKLTIKDHVNIKELPKESVEAEAFSPSRSRARNTTPHILQKEVVRSTGTDKPLAVKETTSNSLQRTETAVPLRIPSSQTPTISKDAQNPTALSKSPVTLYDNPTPHQVSVMSKPLGAPLVPASRPSALMVSVLQVAPLLTRSVSAAGRLATDPSVTHSNAPQSYRNAIMGRTICSSSACFTHSSSNSSSSSVHPSPAYSQPSPVVSLPVPLPQSSSRKDKGLARSGLTFGSVSEDVLQNPPQWLDECSRSDGSSMLSDIQKLDISSSAASRSQTGFNDEMPTSISASPKQGVSVHTSQGQSADEFPHLDIINYLLDEEHNVGKASTIFQSSNNGHYQQLNRHLTFPGNMVLSTDIGSSINCCRYDLPASYHDNGMQHVYGSSSGPFDGLKDVCPQASISYVTSEGMGGFIQNQWPVGGAHVSMLQARTPNGDAYQYQLPEYSNLLCRVDGSSVFRPVNGR